VEGPEHVVGRAEVLKGLAGSLKQAASHTGGVDRAMIHLEHAREAEAQGNLVAAVNALRLALAMTGERPDVLADYDRVRVAYAVSMADTYEKQAKYESRTGRWGDAALSWSKVCDGRPDDGLAHLNAAIALLEAKGDLSSARAYAQTALDLMPGNVLAHRALGRVYAAAGMGLNARRELEKVVKMDPHDDEMKALLKTLAGR
jgi:tetratricopeptide (TPR) repeat protein